MLSKNHLKMFKRSFKYQYIFFFISILVVASFYFYSMKNKKFELDFIFYVKKHNYDHFNLNTNNYTRELKKTIRLNLLKKDYKNIKKHELYFSTVQSNPGGIDKITLKNFVYGKNFEEFLVDEYLEKIASEVQKDYFSILNSKLIALENSMREGTNIEILLKNYDIKESNINLSLALDPFVRFKFDTEIEIMGIKQILKENNHIQYDYNIISKTPNIMTPSIILFFITYFFLSVITGIFFFGRSILK